LFRHHDFEPLIVHKAADMISAVVMVAGGFGSALVPESVLNFQLPDVVFRPLATELEALIDLHCVYRKDEQSPLLASLLDCVHAYLGQHQSTARRAPQAERQQTPARPKKMP